MPNMNPSDLRALLESWPFESGGNIRVVKGSDGREVMQVRTPLGIEQLELEGRPDGRRPAGAESFLDLQRARYDEAKARGMEAAFNLSHAEAEELFAEGTLYYFRYLHLFQARDWSRVARDTTRNIGLFDFVHEHAEEEEDREHLEKWRPYIVRMHGIASIMLEWEAGHHEVAISQARETLRRIQELTDLEDDTFQFERERSLEALREIIAQVEQTRPVPERERLEREMKRAIESQDFERAAALRDRLRAVKERGA